MPNRFKDPTMRREYAYWAAGRDMCA